MPVTSPAAGLGPASSSQHAASRQSQLRRPSAARRTSSANVRRPPGSLSSAPLDQQHPVADAGTSLSTGKSNNNKNNTPNKNANASGGLTRRLSRAASANACRHIDSNPLSPHSGHDVAYLYQQLQDALQQQTRVEEEKQRQLVHYRRQLRFMCDDNATLRNIIQAGETRRRDAAVAVANGVSSTNPAAALAVRAHSSGTRHGPASVTEAELEVLEQRIHLSRQRHNRLMHEVRVNTAALAKEEQAHAMIAEEANAPLDPASLLMGANRPVYLRLMRLEHLLNEVLQKQSAVGIVLKNYRYHLNTLHDEAVQYDVHQRMLEGEYADRHRDHLQLLELYDSARAAYTDMVDTRAALQRSGAKMRHAKERALQRKRRDVEKELANTQLQERRTVDLQQQLEEETQLLEAAENTKAQLEKQRLNSRTALTLLKANASREEGATGDGATNTHGGTTTNADALVTSDNADERISAFEVAFRDMMQVANADTLDHLVDIYQKEMERQCKLQDDLEDLRETRTALQQETQMLRERVKQTKYCVGAGTRFGGDANDANSGGSWKVTAAASPLMERELETFLRDKKEALGVQISENERNQVLLIEVAERMNRLSALVAEYRPDVRLPPIRLSPALSKRSSTLPLHSAVLAQKLLALANDAAAPRGTATPGTNSSGAIGAAGSSSSSSSAPNDKKNNFSGAGGIPVVSSTQLVVPANNRRVPLAHERGSSGSGLGVDSGQRSGSCGGGRRPRYSADVAGISSTAARALLNASGQPFHSLTGSPDAVGTSGNNTFKMRQKRRSSAGAGLGFIEGQDDDEDDGAQLATVAALPPPGGRVLDFDLETSDDSDGSPFSGDSSVQVNVDDTVDENGQPTAAAAASGEGVNEFTSAMTRRRRSSGKGNLAGRSVMASGGSSNARGPNAAVAAVAAEDDQEDPLRRDEVKRMSEMIQERQRREAEEESRHK